MCHMLSHNAVVTWWGFPRLSFPNPHWTANSVSHRLHQFSSLLGSMCSRIPTEVYSTKKLTINLQSCQSDHEKWESEIVTAKRNIKRHDSSVQCSIRGGILEHKTALGKNYEKLYKEWLLEIIKLLTSYFETVLPLFLGCSTLSDYLDLKIRSINS